MHKRTPRIGRRFFVVAAAALIVGCLLFVVPAVRRCPGDLAFDRESLAFFSSLPPAEGRRSVRLLERRFPFNSTGSARASDALDSDVIPRVLVQTGVSDLVPRSIYDATEAILTSSGFQYRFFSDADAEALLKSSCSNVPGLARAFDTLIPGAMKADLFRYCYLLQNGGCYFDLGVNTILDKTNGHMVQLGELLDSAARRGVRVIVPEDNGLGFAYNAVILAAPNHPVFSIALSLATQRVLSRFHSMEDHSPLIPTGPQLFRDALLQHFDGITVEVLATALSSNRRLQRGITKDVAVIDYTRKRHCLSGVIAIPVGMFQSSVFGTLAFSKTSGYYTEFKKYALQEHYGVLWSRGSQFVYRNESQVSKQR